MHRPERVRISELTPDGVPKFGPWRCAGLDSWTEKHREQPPLGYRAHWDSPWPLPVDMEIETGYPGSMGGASFGSGGTFAVEIWLPYGDGWAYSLYPKILGMVHGDVGLPTTVRGHTYPNPSHPKGPYGTLPDGIPAMSRQVVITSGSLPRDMENVR